MADGPKRVGEDVERREHIKPKLSIDQQIAHLRAKGVKFEKCGVEEARVYLSHERGFYELTAYRKLFTKRQGGERDGEYANLDFAQLVAFAELDESLRDALLVMTRQIEHYQGTKLNYAIDEREDEDGYAIVEDFLLSLKPESKDYMEKEFDRSAFSPYTRGIHEKYSGDKSAWAFLKVASFGSLVDFMRFCGRRWDDERLGGSHYNMKRVKSVRNCAAHGSCIINSFAEVDNAERPASREVHEAAAKTGASKATRRKWLHNSAVQEIATTLVVYADVVPEGKMRQNGIARLKSFFDEADEVADLLPSKGPDAKATAAISFVKSLTKSLGLLK